MALKNSRAARQSTKRRHSKVMSMARQRPTAHGMSVSSTIFHPWYPFWERAFEATYLVKQPTLNDRIDFRVLHLLAMKTNIRSASAVWNSYKPLMWDLRVHQTDHVSLSTSWIETARLTEVLLKKLKSILQSWMRFNARGTRFISDLSSGRMPREQQWKICQRSPSTRCTGWSEM